MICTNAQGRGARQGGKVQTLKSEFDVLNIKYGESMDEFSMKMIVIINGIRAFGDKVEEVYVVKKLMRTVSQRLIQILTSEQFSEFKNMTM